MDVFLRNASQILETACAPGDSAASELLILISRGGNVRMLCEAAGWSLPAAAAEYGAAAVYRVQREGTRVRVEGWSAGRNCVLDQKPAETWWASRSSSPAYASATFREAAGASANDRSPQVWNS